MKLVFGILLLFGVPTAQAAFEDVLADAFKNYKAGRYFKVIEELDGLNVPSKFRPVRPYWIGLAYNKLQKFDKAIPYFEEALKEGADMEDIHYEYGQALYASQESEKAFKAFRRSAETNYMRPMSLYYMGYISQMLEDYQKAIKAYSAITDKNKEMYQSGQMQIGEILYIQAQKEKNPYGVIRKYVFPQFDKAKDILPTGTLVAGIEKRVYDIKDKFGHAPDKYENGKKMPKKRTSFRTTINYNYDTNVITEAEEAPSKTSPEFKESGFYKVDFQLRRKFIFARRLLIAPQIKFNYTEYEKSTVPNIFRNDQWTLLPSVAFELHHNIFNKNSVVTFDIDYQYQDRKTRLIQEFVRYGQTISYALGHKIKLFGKGDTNFKIKRRQFYGELSTLDTVTNTISLSQTFLFGSKILLILLNADFNDLIEDPNADSNSYMVRVDYIHPKIWGKLKFSAAMSTTFMDTRKQSPTRGTEKMYNPSAKLSYPILKKLEITASYSYTRNISEAKTTNQYEKQVTGLELQLSL